MNMPKFGKSSYSNLVTPKEADWGKADLHLHTSYSDGYMTPAETVDLIAEHTPLDVIAVTDHDTADGAFVAQTYAQRRHPQLEVIIGQEVSTGDGDVLGLFLKATLPTFPSAAAAIEAIHEQGGLAVAAHPFVIGAGMCSVGRTILELPYDAVEARHGCPLNIPSNIVTPIANRFGQRLPELGNSDSHIPFTAGQAFTWFPGRTGADLRRAIEIGSVRPGGSVWKIRNILRTLPFVLKYGLPDYQAEL